MRTPARPLQLAFLLSALSCSAAVAACTSSGSFHEGEFTGGEADFQVGELSADWTRVAVRDQNDLAFIHGPTSAIIQANASCSPAHDIPLEALRNHLLIGFTERETVDERRVPLDDREALDVHLRAKLDGVPVELRLTIIKKNDCVFDMALVASPDTFGRVQPEYDAFLRGFHTEGHPALRAYR